MIFNHQRFAKLISILLCLTFACSVLLTGVCVYADENDQTQSGGGDTEAQGYIGASSPVILPDREVSFTVYFDGKSALAVSATFEYPSNLMEYRGFECKVDGFSLSVTPRIGENGVSYLDVFGMSMDLVTSLKGVTSVVSFDFYINKDASDGDSVYLNMKGATASDGDSDYPLSELSFQAKVSLYDTTVPVIESLKVNGKPLEGFSSDVSQYSFKVEYSVTVLSLDITCQQGTTATYKGHENLIVGENTVYIDVVSETGNKHTYTLKVERLADPNHVISTDATLSDIKLSAGFVTPALSPDVLDYVIYLPADITELTLEPIVANEYAEAQSKTVVLGEFDDRTVEISVTAEDGRVLVYTFTLLVTPSYNGKVPIINDGNNDISGIDFSDKEKGLYLPLPAFIEEFLEDHDIGGTELLIAVAVMILFVLTMSVILLTLLKKKKKNKKTVVYVEDSLEGAGFIEKNGAVVSDDDIETNVF